MPIELKEPNKQRVGFFRFKRLNGEYLLTSDIGEYCFLSPKEFDLFLGGTRIEQIYPYAYKELLAKGFIRDKLDLDGFSKKYALKNVFLGSGPSLHIVVVTLRCDHRCSYCQTNAYGLEEKRLDMDIPTAQNTVDRIFESPNTNITIEFQGGEPLANWDTVRFIVEYASKKNKIAKKNLLFSLVSNLTFMTKERLEFLLKNNVAICTSLDGPEVLHNKNRISRGKNNNYRNTIKWIRKIQEEISKNKNYKYKLNALTTITKPSLSSPKRIIDEFVKLGLEEIHLRPVGPFGLNRATWDKLGISAEDFSGFYQKAMDYVIELNLKGKKIKERTAKIFLSKILLNNDPNYLDVRSPCGAGIGQLAYNFNGDVYTCDEGRMLSVMGDESFRLGNVGKNTYKELVNNEVVKTMCLSSCLDNLPACNECVYKSYCGVCPIYNYVIEGSIFSLTPNNARCKMHNMELDYIFGKLNKQKSKEVLLKWTEEK